MTSPDDSLGAELLGVIARINRWATRQADLAITQPKDGCSRRSTSWARPGSVTWHGPTTAASPR